MRCEKGTDIYPSLGTGLVSGWACTSALEMCDLREVENEMKNCCFISLVKSFDFFTNESMGLHVDHVHETFFPTFYSMNEAIPNSDYPL